MSYIDNYLNHLTESGNPALADAVRDTVDKITPAYITTFSYKDHVVSLLEGNVQSGKTSHLFGLICSAADEGFKLFVLLTTDNNLLQQQTLYRVRKDLPDFCVCGESDEYSFFTNNMKRPAIVVLKKNGQVLKRWKNNFSSSHFCEGNPLFIVDDEADAASLNTLINRNKQSTVNKNLEEIKKTASSSIYIQVTGTPQALLLQSYQSGWRPYFTHYFSPGKGYIGGNELFPYDRPPYVILTDNEEATELLKDDEFAENGLKKAVLYHLVSSAEIFLNGGTVSNFLIHPSVKTDQHQKFAEKVGDYLNEIFQSIDEPFVNEAFTAVYNDLAATKPSISPFDVIMENITLMLETDGVNILVINSRNSFEDNVKYESGVNIIVGGNSLGRGVTIPKLQTTYYCRVAKSPQADTMWQHSRMFGYDRDLGLMRVFIPPVLYKLFAEINAANNSIISQIEKGRPEEVNIHYPEKLRPTRKNVLDEGVVKTFTGGVNYFPFYPENKDISKLDSILERFGEDTYSVNLRLFEEILENITSESDDWEPEDFKGFIQTIRTENPSAQGRLIVRRNRDIGKGTGTLLSPTDRALGDSITDEAVLTMYKITGNKDKGWNGAQIWIPNVKLPGKEVYYCI
ncbi:MULTISPECIES: Z1 domain-containing protein [Dehalobacter]|uniref:Restriction endonuclease n=1 Tax=Dehalobacter restrictus TaxID=55583 RepID=A0A857DKD0_9FIRM|nr:Z1 domain-containing protein [Dehalobacter restrictus]QHA01058.1 restriction endonuclease [Dehalobacter restrictus]UWG95971.1 Z1 domain-containing protein [Dehalobacter sp. DCM]